MSDNRWEEAARALYKAADLFPTTQSCDYTPKDCPPDDPECEPCELRRACRLFELAADVPLTPTTRTAGPPPPPMEPRADSLGRKAS